MNFITQTNKQKELLVIEKSDQIETINSKLKGSFTREGERANDGEEVKDCQEKVKEINSMNSTSDILIESLNQLLLSKSIYQDMWSEAPTNDFVVRGPSYLQDHIKITPSFSFFKPIRLEMFKGDPSECFPISSKSQAFLQQLRLVSPPSSFFLLVNFLIPGTPSISVTSYYIIKNKVDNSETSHPFHKLWKDFLEGDDEYRRSRLKVIPRVRDGPWIVRKAIGATPLIIGKALEVKYKQEESFLEICFNLASDPIAKKVVALCRLNVNLISIDIAMVLEGKQQNELPEALLASITYSYLDLTKAIEL